MIRWQDRAVIAARWALVAAGLTAAFWAVWLICAGQLPDIGNIRFDDAGWLYPLAGRHDLIVLSHWWDVAGVAGAAFILIWGLLSFDWDRIGGDEAIGVSLIIYAIVSVLFAFFIVLGRLHGDWSFWNVKPMACFLVGNAALVLFWMAWCLPVSGRRSLVLSLLGLPPLCGLTVGLVQGLTGCGLLTMPALGLAAGLAVSLAVALPVLLVWLVIIGLQKASGLSLANGFRYVGRWLVGRDRQERIARREARLVLAERLTVPGTRVRIRRDSQFAFQHSGTGQVRGLARPGWVNVGFGDDYVNCYRIGQRLWRSSDCWSGRCDLELVEDETSPDEQTVDSDPPDPRYPNGRKPEWLEGQL